jgi:creatinine amidohydrolase
MKHYILAETNWKEIKDSEIDLAVLPWGATEAHNYHLPYSTDNVQVTRIASEAAGIAWEGGAKIIVLPTIPFGVHTGQLDIKLNLNLNPSTQFAIIRDIADVLNRHEILKLLIINGHGGNDFRQMIRELRISVPKMFICSCNWYQSVDPTDFFENQGGHADEMETSIMQFLAPDLVLPLAEAGDGSNKKFKIKALNEKWAWAERKWTEVSKDTGIGNPCMANPDKGKRFYTEVVRKISSFMTELSNTDIDDMYL